MSIDYQQLLRRSAEHVALFFVEHSDPRIQFHNQEYTTDIVNQARDILGSYKVNERESALVSIAAWFLNTGYYLKAPYANASIENAADFLRTSGAPPEDIEFVDSVMKAALGLKPANTLTEKILHDAARVYTGTESFRDVSKRARREAERLTGIELNGEQWSTISAEQLSKEPFLTDYAILRFDPVRQQNIQALYKKKQDRIEKQERKAKKRELAQLQQAGSIPTGENAEVDFEYQGNSYDIRSIKKKGGPTRGIETMFRVSSTNQQRLSVMADNKAHILISVNSIIISVAIAVVIGKFGQQPDLLIPTIMLLAVNVFTIIFSILATRPKVSAGVFTPEQLENKTVNLLYFGSYYRMGFEDYENGMAKMINDSDFLYRTLMKNIYWQGKVIGHKFSLLRIAYNIFMYGIAISVIAYTVTALYYHI
ncbi:MAG TPA: Pycsar system effector family protein [Flavitalea sp.]|nr:Pycsar system effector family protein [Flavitalea sp.]